MDLIAARDAINELIEIDGEIASTECAERIAAPGDRWTRDITHAEWLMILRTRKSVAEDKLREVGVVAAHQPKARTFRDRPIDDAKQVADR